MNLKKSLVSILNRNNYKYIIIVLIGIIILFLMGFGNYNLVEGNEVNPTLDEHEKNLESTKESIVNSSIGMDKKKKDLLKSGEKEGIQLEISKEQHSLDYDKRRVRDLETFVEGMNHCGTSNLSELGSGGRANSMFNALCENQEMLVNQNS
tara:strand:- start:1679 stop:2131 length:453 start_codon:yes stop_codon:yes gene_type:complete